MWRILYVLIFIAQMFSALLASCLLGRALFCFRLVWLFILLLFICFCKFKKQATTSTNGCVPVRYNFLFISLHFFTRQHYPKGQRLRIRENVNEDSQFLAELPRPEGPPGTEHHWHLLVVIMASGIARGRVRTTTTTTESRNMAAITETRLNLVSRPHP